jgi:hypothetical protein
MVGIAESDLSVSFTPMHGSHLLHAVLFDHGLEEVLDEIVPMVVVGRRAVDGAVVHHLRARVLGELCRRETQSVVGKQELTAEVVAVGDKIRAAKADKVSKEALAPLLAALGAAKAAFKEATGEDYGPAPQAKSGGGKKAKGGKEAAKAPAAAAAAPAAPAAAAGAAAAADAPKEGGEMSKSEQKRLAKQAKKVESKDRPAKAAAAKPVTAPPAAGAVAAPGAEEYLVDFDEYRQAYQYTCLAARAPPAAPAAAAVGAVAIPFTGSLVGYLTAAFEAGIEAAFPTLGFKSKSASIVTRSKVKKNMQRVGKGDGCAASRGLVQSAVLLR